MDKEKIGRPIRSPKVLACLAAIGIVGGLSGCGSKWEYEPIKVPKGAVYLGVTNNDTGVDPTQFYGPGQSFRVNESDAAQVSCGQEVESGDPIWNEINTPSKEVRVLGNGLTQIICHGAHEGYPVEYFEPHEMADTHAAK